jgi:hypothetical protein
MSGAAIESPRARYLRGQRAGEEAHRTEQLVIEVAAKEPVAVVVEHCEEHVQEAHEDQEHAS